jgi:sugar phosphate permease
VPPTVRLVNDLFGKRDAPVIFGWILTGHQIGAAVAAIGAGTMRTELGGYLEAFILAGIACVATAFMVLWIGRRSRQAALAAS